LIIFFHNHFSWFCRSFNGAWFGAVEGFKKIEKEKKKRKGKEGRKERKRKRKRKGNKGRGEGGTEEVPVRLLVEPLDADSSRSNMSGTMTLATMVHWSKKAGILSYSSSTRGS
jgi:hypothetical protein